MFINTTVMMVVSKCNGFACLQAIQDANRTVVLWRSAGAVLEHSAFQLSVPPLLTVCVCGLSSKYTSDV